MLKFDKESLTFSGVKSSKKKSKEKVAERTEEDVIEEKKTKLQGCCGHGWGRRKKAA